MSDNEELSHVELDGIKTALAELTTRISVKGTELQGQLARIATVLERAAGVHELSMTQLLPDPDLWAEPCPGCGCRLGRKRYHNDLRSMGVAGVDCPGCGADRSEQPPVGATLTGELTIDPAGRARWQTGDWQSSADSPASPPSSHEDAAADPSPAPDPPAEPSPQDGAGADWRVMFPQRVDGPGLVAFEVRGSSRGACGTGFTTTDPKGTSWRCACGEPFEVRLTWTSTPREHLSPSLGADGTIRVTSDRAPQIGDRVKTPYGEGMVDGIGTISSKRPYRVRHGAEQPDVNDTIAAYSADELTVIRVPGADPATLTADWRRVLDLAEAELEGRGTAMEVAMIRSHGPTAAQRATMRRRLESLSEATAAPADPQPAPEHETATARYIEPAATAVYGWHRQLGNVLDMLDESRGVHAALNAGQLLRNDIGDWLGQTRAAEQPDGEPHYFTSHRNLEGVGNVALRISSKRAFTVDSKPGWCCGCGQRFNAELEMFAEDFDRDLAPGELRRV